MESIVQPLLVAVPATIAAIAACRGTRKTWREVQTNHGQRAGERIERLGESLDQVIEISMSHDEKLKELHEEHTRLVLDHKKSSIDQSRIATRLDLLELGILGRKDHRG